MNRDPLRLRAVTALPNQSLHLVFQDGFEADVGLGDWIANTSALQALADDYGVPISAILAASEPDIWSE